MAFMLEPLVVVDVVDQGLGGDRIGGLDQRGTEHLERAEGRR